MPNIKYTEEYQAIQNFYEGKTAKRSNQPYMKHIDEGLKYLEAVEASHEAQCAYALHPIFQSTGAFKDLIDGGLLPQFTELNFRAVALAVEYRHIANGYLLKHYRAGEDLKISPILEVNQMLWADKMQNRSDFRKFHLGTHRYSSDLEAYFELWLETLQEETGYPINLELTH